MHLIIGGAYQGKLTWVKTTYNIAEHETLDLTQNDPIPGYRCYLHLEALTRRDEHPERWLPVLESAIVLAREIGGGIVPLDPAERAWRERHGAMLQTLAARAERVTRVLCGLTEELK